MRRGLQPRAVSTGRAAVIALDLITDFAFPDGPRVRRALTRHSSAIRRLLDRARSERVPVFYANDNLGDWRSDAPALIAHCTESRRAGAALVQALSPQKNDEIVLKPRHSAFFGTPLVALLDDRRIDTLVIVGISAESCVWMTACDAHTRGFRLVIPADTLAGASSAAVRRTLTSLREVLGARVPARARTIRFQHRRLR
ncbi:MAG TPA: isochorismatase family cysteine hydrolase [Steroidobacteraceae bacterium]|nr:isochorismatase family cysteine hydrolase [Steroidobacteraceae bacterium]